MIGEWSFRVAHSSIMTAGLVRGAAVLSRAKCLTPVTTEMTVRCHPDAAGAQPAGAAQLQEGTIHGEH